VTKKANDTDNRLKNINEEKKDRNKDIRELQHELANLQWKLQGFVNRETEHKQKKAEELQAIESQRVLLQHTAVLNDRKLENEERLLQSKFVHHKQESARSFNKSHDDMKKYYQSQNTEISLKEKSDIDHLNQRKGNQLEELKNQNKLLIREYDSLSIKIKQLSEEEDMLSKSLRKEKMISEANNTALIDWLPKSCITEGHRSNVADLEKIVNDLRQRQLEEGGKLLLANQQKQAAIKELKKVKNESLALESDLNSLENSKKDAERRLVKRVSEYEVDLTKKRSDTFNGHSLKKSKLQSDVSHVSEEIKGLKKQISELQHEITRNNESTHNMSEKLNQKLESERNRLFEIESGKRNLEIKTLSLEQEHETLKGRLMTLEKEVARYRLQAEEVSKILSDQEDLGHQLEFQVKLLEARI